MAEGRSHLRSLPSPDPPIHSLIHFYSTSDTALLARLGPLSGLCFPPYKYIIFFFLLHAYSSPSHTPTLVLFRVCTQAHTLFIFLLSFLCF